jgi:hypothetical protein
MTDYEVRTAVKVAAELATTDAHRAPHFTKVFPTENLARLWLRRAIRERRFNYFIGWRDVAGWGLSATWVSWVGEGPPHVDLHDNAGMVGW